MGYRKIPNLYKEREILDLFKEIYALEKIHGTSAHISFIQNQTAPDGKLSFFSGGSKYNNFIKIFDKEDLIARFKKFGAHVLQEGITVYGEAYGGKVQAMRETYGPNLKFIAFEVKIGDTWLSVPKAEVIALNLGLEFVDYVKGPATIDFVNQERDKESTQAIRNGMGSGKMREGIVIRPLVELTKNNGKRLITKHKNEEFKETKTPRPLSKEQLEVLTKAQEIADEWVVNMRLDHVLDKLRASGINTHSMTATGQVVRAMIEDVKVESYGEVVWSKAVEKEIGRKTAKLYKSRVTSFKE